MTTTGVFLRSLVRLSGAEAGFIAPDRGADILAACGLTLSAAAETLAALRAGSLLPGGLEAGWALPILADDAERGATLYLLPRPPGVLDSSLAEIIGALAAEIGRERDRGLRFQAGGSLSGSVLIGTIAAGIDSLNDAAAIVEWPRTGSSHRIIHVNEAFEALLGYGAAEVVGSTPHLFHGPLTDPARGEFINDRVRESSQARIPIVYYRRDGVPLWIEVSLRGIAGTSGDERCMVATLRDVTARKEFEFALAKEKRKLQVTLAAIGDGVITTIADGRIDSINVAARTMLGIEAAEAYGEQIADVLRLCDAAGARIDVLHGADGPRGVHRGQAQFERNPSVKEAAYVTSPIGDEGYVVVLRDITAQERLSSQLSYEASHDPLTNIFNRRKFDQVLGDAIHSAHRKSGPHALALLDLDRFKIINDTCGHAVGDRVLRDIARLLQTELRERDVVARIGGDEFAALLHDCSLENARRVLQNLRLAVENYRVESGENEYRVGVSIGLTVIDDSEADASVILARADAACYAAKPGGRKQVAS